MLHWILTGLALFAFIGLAVFANHKSTENWDEPRPRLIPWRMVMLFSVFFALMAIVHGVNLLGFETGPEHAVFGRW